MKKKKHSAIHFYYKISILLSAQQLVSDKIILSMYIDIECRKKNILLFFKDYK